MYKLTRLNGKDFYSNSVDYAINIGKIIRVTDFDLPKIGACGRGLHASKNPNDCFVGAKIPCRAFQVSGRHELAGDSQKCRYKALKVIKEITDLDTLFGWNYSAVINPIHPFSIKPPQITGYHTELVTQWASVWDSVWASVWASVEASVGASVWDFVWASVWASVEASVGASVGASVWDSVGASVRASVWASVWDSVRASVEAYISSFFPNIKIWKYVDHKKGENPFQPCIDLWLKGIVPSYDGDLWRLHGGPKCEVLAEIKI